VTETEYQDIRNDMSKVAHAEKVFSQHADFIRSILRFRVGDEDLANDLFQDYFLSLVAKPIPKNVQNIKSYIYRAIANDTFDAVRRVERYHGRIQRYAEKKENSINIERPENALIEKEETEKLFGMIERLLPVSESKAIALKFRNDHSVGQVARKMGVNKRSVSRYISVGLKKIRQYLSEKEEA